MHVSKQETLRYLGYGGSTPGSAENALIEECMQKTEKRLTPRCIYKRLPLTFLKSGVACIGSLTINSSALFKAINACESAFLFAATIGAGIDELLRFESAVSIARAAVIQAAAASAVESYCNEQCSQIEQQLKPEGLFLRPRFSPGYGDFELSFQTQILSILNAQKIGLSCTESLMLLPTKSVTAVIGVAKAPCSQNSCRACSLQGCEFKKIF